MGRRPGPPVVFRHPGRQIYICRFTVNGKRFTRSTGQRDLVSAKAVATRMLHRAGLDGDTEPTRLKPIAPWPILGGVYFVLSGSKVKIGKAASIYQRLSVLQMSNPEPLRLIAVMPGGMKEEAEQHKRWGELRISGEWFALSEELVAFMLKLRKEPGHP